MKLILEIMLHTDDEMIIHRTVESFPVTLGRGFHNDIILTDPSVSPQHLRIDYHDGSWFVTDLESANGLSINMTQQRGKKLPVQSGDTVRIGQTELRLYAPHHPVADTVRLEKTPPIFLWLARPLNVWICFMMAILIVEGWSYFEVWAEQPGMVLAGAAASAAGIVLVWTALWSVAGQLIKHKSHFRSHASLICLYLSAGVLSWYVETYVNFLTNENWFADLVAYGINFILLAALLYGSLTLTSRMNRRRTFSSSVFFSFGVTAGIFLLGLIGAKNFNQQPIYPATLEPYLSFMAPADAVDQFMTGNERLFSSKEFKKTSVKKPH